MSKRAKAAAAVKAAFKTNGNGRQPVPPDLLAVRPVLYTPDMCIEILERPGTVNRTIRQGHVTKLATDMAAGNWVDNGETVKFKGSLETGLLMDGQHRLWAIIESDRPQYLLTVEGLTGAEMHTIDAGSTRIYADVLKIRGEKTGNPLVSAAVARWILWYETTNRRGSPKSRGVSHSVLDGVVKLNPDLFDATFTACNSKAARVLTPAIASFTYLLAQRVNGHRALSWLEAVGSGAQLEIGDPALTLRERIMADRNSRLKMSQIYKLALSMKSASVYVRGGTVKKLVWNEGEPFPEIKAVR